MSDNASSEPFVWMDGDVPGAPGAMTFPSPRNDHPDPVIPRRSHYELVFAPHQVPMPLLPMESTLQGLDLRDLEYVPGYDIQIECAICKIPMIDPLRLYCSHHFCRTCLYQTEKWDVPGDKVERWCPSCRTPIMEKPEYAERLIINICNDVKVECPNKGCDEILARCDMDNHMAKYCPEMVMACPDVTCQFKISRRHLHGENICRHIHAHDSYYCETCECGVKFPHIVIDTHREQACPASSRPCPRCGDPLNTPGHLALACTPTKTSCIGAPLGCKTRLAKDEVDDHMRSCLHARIQHNINRQIEKQTYPLTREIKRLREKISEVEAPLKDQINILAQEMIRAGEREATDHRQVRLLTENMQELERRQNATERRQTEMEIRQRSLEDDLASDLDVAIRDLEAQQHEQIAQLCGPAERRGRGGRGGRRGRGGPGGRGGRGGRGGQGQQGEAQQNTDQAMDQLW